MIHNNRMGSVIVTTQEDRQLLELTYTRELVHRLCELRKDINWPFGWEIQKVEPGNSIRLKLMTQPFFSLPGKPAVVEIHYTETLGDPLVLNFQRRFLAGQVAALIDKAARSKIDGSNTRTAPTWARTINTIIAQLQYYTEALPGWFYGTFSVSMQDLEPKIDRFRLYGTPIIHKMGGTEILGPVQFKPTTAHAEQVPAQILEHLKGVISELLQSYRSSFAATEPVEVTHE